MARFIIMLFLVLTGADTATARSLYFATPDKITNWVISCSVDHGSIIARDNTWIFTTSRNKCKGGVFRQRAEINTKGALSTKKKAQYRFRSYFRMQSEGVEKFDIFQIHDSRDGCAPPLKVNVQPSGRIKLRADYKTGPGEQCIRNVMKSSGLGKTQIKRDGREYKLDVLLDFDGAGGFDVAVFLDDRFEVSGRYDPPKGKGYEVSRYFYFKHGVYSYRMFDYRLTSRISMRLLKSLDKDEKAFEQSRLSKSKQYQTQLNKPIVVPANLGKLLTTDQVLLACIKAEAFSQNVSEESLNTHIDNAIEGGRVAVYRVATWIRNGFCTIP